MAEKWTTRRKLRLIHDGFLLWELRRSRSHNRLEGLIDFPLRRPYIMRMRIARRRLLEDAKDRRLTMAQYRRLVDKTYRDMGWLGKDGKPDIWAMFRYFYQQSIMLGDYIPPLKKRQGWGKGDVKSQRKRYKGKQRAKKVMGIETPSGDIADWLAQLRTTLADETNPDRIKQLKGQIERLEKMQREGVK